MVLRERGTGIDQMQLVEQHIIRSTSPQFVTIDAAAFAAGRVCPASEADMSAAATAAIRTAPTIEGFRPRIETSLRRP